MKKSIGWLLVLWTMFFLVRDLLRILDGSGVPTAEESQMLLFHDAFFLIALAGLFAYAFDLFGRSVNVTIQSQPYDTLVERLAQALKESNFRKWHSKRDWGQTLWQLFGPLWRWWKGKPRPWECPRCAEDLTDIPEEHVCWLDGGVQPSTPDLPENHWGTGLKCCTRCGEIFEFEDSSC